MITDPSSTTTFPGVDSSQGIVYTLDDAYYEAQDSLWSPLTGALITWALFACLCIQMYFYVRNFPSDNRVIRVTVFALFAVEVAGTAWSTWAIYIIVIRGWGHMPFFAPQMWGAMLFDCTVASMVHALYAWRIYVLIQPRSLAYAFVLIIALLSMAQFSCCVAAAMFNALQAIQGPGKQYVARHLFHAWIACASVADIIIALIITIKLYASRTGIAATDRIIKKILYITAPGGAATAIITLLILVIQLKYTGRVYYQFLISSLTKVYSNSVLLCLNLRVTHRFSGTNGASSRGSTTPGGFGATITGTQSSLTRTGRQNGTCAVSIHREVEKSSTLLNFPPLSREENISTTLEATPSSHSYGSAMIGKARSLWHKSSSSSTNVADDTYGKAYISGPTISTVNVSLPFHYNDHPFSESMNSHRLDDGSSLATEEPRHH